MDLEVDIDVSEEYTDTIVRACTYNPTRRYNPDQTTSIHIFIAVRTSDLSLDRCASEFVKTSLGLRLFINKSRYRSRCEQMLNELTL